MEHDGLMLENKTVGGFQRTDDPNQLLTQPEHSRRTTNLFDGNKLSF